MSLNKVVTKTLSSTLVTLLRIMPITSVLSFPASHSQWCHLFPQFAHCWFPYHSFQHIPCVLAHAAFSAFHAFPDTRWLQCYLLKEAFLCVLGALSTLCFSGTFLFVLTITSWYCYSFLRPLDDWAVLFFEATLLTSKALRGWVLRNLCWTGSWADTIDTASGKPWSRPMLPVGGRLKNTQCQRP